MIWGNAENSELAKPLAALEFHLHAGHGQAREGFEQPSDMSGKRREGTV